MKKIIETIFAKNLSKKVILGTSDAWSMSHLAHRSSDPAYYIEDCQISGSVVYDR